VISPVRRSEDPVAAGAADDLSGRDRDDQHADHQRKELQAGDRRRLTVHDLEEDRQIGDRAKHREAYDESDDARHRDALIENRWRGSTGSIARRSTNVNTPTRTAPRRQRR